jgi:aspartyl-tRNA(Asn)/glutamyl-tRNA(Gln) amidotransferase subunit A
MNGSGEMLKQMFSESAASHSISEQRDLLHTRKLSAIETVTAFLDNMSKKRDLNIFITENREGALEQAREADRRIAEGTSRGLEGIPIAVKDNYCTKGIRTTAGSKVLEHFVPTYESTVTRRLIEAGAVILGKTNMDEFAMGSSTETSYFGPTINPLGIPLGFSGECPWVCRSSELTSATKQLLGRPIRLNLTS